jgi:hypothetical protein
MTFASGRGFHHPAAREKANAASRKKSETLASQRERADRAWVRCPACSEMVYAKGGCYWGDDQGDLTKLHRHPQGSVGRIVAKEMSKNADTTNLAN